MDFVNWRDPIDRLEDVIKNASSQPHFLCDYCEKWTVSGHHCPPKLSPEIERATLSALDTWVRRPAT